VRLTHRITALLGGRRKPERPATAQGLPSTSGAAASPDPAAPDPRLATSLGTRPSNGPAAASAAPADPCEPSRIAMNDACSLADRMQALALAAQERLREARRAYDQHAGRREQAAAVSDPRVVHAAKDEAQAAFRAARLAAQARSELEVAAREWLREIDRVNARTREAARELAREATARTGLVQAVERLSLEADGARIAAESAREACLGARIALAACEESGSLGGGPQAEGGLSAQESAVAGIDPTAFAPQGRGPGPGAGALAPAAAATRAEPAYLPLLAGNRDVMRRIAAALAEGDAAAAVRWQGHLSALVEAVRARAIDGAALSFPDAGFWAPYTQVQRREIGAALAALGYRYDGRGGFADGRVPGQRELSLAIGYTGMDPTWIRIWPSEAELLHLYSGVQVDAGRFVSEAAGELTLGDMVELLGRRAEDLSELWNAWGRVRPLLLGPA
jgi:hypothetical protein